MFKTWLLNIFIKYKIQKHVQKITYEHVFNIKNKKICSKLCFWTYLNKKTKL